MRSAILTGAGILLASAGRRRPEATGCGHRADRRASRDAAWRVAGVLHLDLLLEIVLDEDGSWLLDDRDR